MGIFSIGFLIGTLVVALGGGIEGLKKEWLMPAISIPGLVLSFYFNKLFRSTYEKNKKTIKEVTDNLVEPVRSRSGPGAQSVESEDSGDILLIPGTSGEMILCSLNKDKGTIKSTTFNRSEIQRVEIVSYPEKWLTIEVSGGNSLSKLVLAGTIVGGLPGLALTGIIASERTRLKESDVAEYSINAKFHIAGAKQPLEFRITKKICSSPKTEKGQEEIAELVKIANKYVNIINKNFSDFL